MKARARPRRRVDYIEGSLRSGSLTIVGPTIVMGFARDRRRGCWSYGDQSRKDHDGGYLMAGGYGCLSARAVRDRIEELYGRPLGALTKEFRR